MSATWKELKMILRGIIDELSDQNAYRRHLVAHRAEHSAEQWRLFSDERWQEKARRGKCC